MAPEASSPQEVLALRPEALKSVEASMKLYEAALQKQPPTLRRVLKWLWTVGGLAGLIALAWAEPWSARFLAAARAAGWPAWLLDYVGAPLAMIARGVLLVEAFGYAYHRFFQHLGFLTRRAQMFRRNQRYHWIHHMILYPIGRFYKRPVPYVSSEGGIGLSWAIPAILVVGLAFATLGVNWGTLIFMATAVGYAYFVVDDVHARFHLARHSYMGNRYFQWLEEIHVLHHWDQRTNFTIVHPAMDWLFGTYLAPKAHQRELRAALDDMELTVSDLINWRYLLIEATPAEYAAFISEAKRHPRSLRKIGHLMEILHHRLRRRPDDAQARDLRERARELLRLVAPA